MNYAKALKLARAITGIQQKELARRAEMDASYVSLIEQNKRTPSTKVIHKLSEALGLPPHLFTLLAMEKQDMTLAHPDELKSLGESLARLLLEREHHDPKKKSSKKKKSRTS